ncbi:BID domain-containing T4SS effector [Bartonella gliris]|uniref:BID domain-containing T4SS effector n=1 Tax=Bartonella gliris TaxID=3004109 RepID=UPI003872F0E5
MKKNQPSPSAPLSVKELRKLYEQSALGTSSSESLQATPAPKDKRQPSPKLEEFKKRYEHAALGTSSSESLSAKDLPKDQKQPYMPENPEKLQRHHEQSATTPKQSVPQASLYATSAPQKPPRTRISTQNSASTQESEVLYATSAPQKPIRVAPQRPPRMKDIELNKPKAQESEVLYATAAPPKPPRTRISTQNSASTQESEVLYATSAPQKPIRVAPQRPPRMKDIELNKPKAQEGEILYATAAPQKPPRTRISTQNNASSQNDDIIYQTPTPQASPRVGDREQNSASTQESVTPQPTMAPPKPSRMSGASINTMQLNILTEAYHEEVHYWCEIVYKNRLVLDQKIQEIRENPAMAKQLSWMLSKYPEHIAPLAGKKTLGIKTKTRKAAEEGLSSLSTAIEGYAYTIQYTQESALHVPQTEQRRHGQTTESMQTLENLQNPLNPERERERAPLSQREIAKRVPKDPSVIYCQTEIQYWCKVVYGNPLVLQERMEEIQKAPDLGEELAWQVTNYPRLFSKLTGHKILGIKSDERKKAEEALPTLCNAIEDYSDAVKQARKNIVQAHQAQQKRADQSPERDKNLQQQQGLSESPQRPERLTVSALVHQEAAGPSRQADNRSLDVRPRRTGTPKTMAFAS